MTKYAAAHIDVEVEVDSYEAESRGLYAQTHPRRTVKLSFHERFKDDAGLDHAIDALAATIREAARR